MVLAVVVGAWLIVGRRGSDYIPGHAYEIPSGTNRLIVEVLNGSGRQGLARTGTRLLRRQGIDVVFFGNADHLVDSTRVVVRRGGGEVAGRVVTALGVGTISLELDTLRRVDISVILGKDFRPPAEMHP